MAEGKVKWFSDRKGYGFITMDDNSKDIFVHTTALSEGLVTLSEGDEVEFDLIESEKGPKAEKVKKIR
jgi:CspA family cold shock protein